uniref:Nuclear cap binding subunit 3 n=1 Tax=Salvator merianae TaxID=96440 RepID=A0A8D0BR14_SALMN
MKTKAGAEIMDAVAAAERRVCQNCKRDVAAANFSLHEAHCLRFLTVCPKCQEPVARKDMEEHLGQAHQQVPGWGRGSASKWGRSRCSQTGQLLFPLPLQVRCPLCHHRMQQYLLEQHQVEECQERPTKCSFCELEMPHHRLQAHLDLCSSRTTMCWDCGKYVTYKSLAVHTLRCQATQKPSDPGPNASLCQSCNTWFLDEQYLQHLNECTPLSQLLGALSTHSPQKQSSPPSLAASPPSNVAEAEKTVRPKMKEKALSSVGRPSLKPPKSRKGPSPLPFTATVDDDSYNQFGSCSRCNILLPRPVLQKHERKCTQAASLPALRRSPRLLGKGGEST